MKKGRHTLELREQTLARILPGLIYDPRIYWNWRGDNYTRDDTQWELNNLTQWITKLKPKSILDVGQGWGHVYGHLRATGYSNDITMCDIADTMREGCQGATGILPDKWDGETLPYENDSFDLVLSIWVFLHVQPENLVRMFEEHKRVTRRWLSILTLFEHEDTLSIHCFLHDYGELFRKHSVKVLDERRDGEAVHWLLKLAT